VIKPHLSPKVIPSTTLLAHLPFYLKEETPLAQARAIKRMDMVMIPPIVRMKSLMMQGPTDPLDDCDKPAQENTVLSPKTNPLWSLSNSKVSSCR
jgi:hypothetical protein